MNRFLLFALVVCLPLTARADDASRLAKAHQMIELAHVDRLTTQVMDGLMQQIQNVVAQQTKGDLTPERTAALADFQKKLVAVIEPQIGWKAVEPEFADLYSKNFTEEQLDAIIAFYKSPAGAALMAKMPEINQQANQLLQARIVAIEPQVRQMFEDFKKAQLATPPADSTAPAPPASGAPAPAPTLGPGAPK